MLSADNVTLYANDSLASHQKTSPEEVRFRERNSKGDHSLNPNAYGLEFCGNTNSPGGPGLGHDLRCEAKKARRVFNIGGGRPKAICGVS